MIDEVLAHGLEAADVGRAVLQKDHLLHVLFPEVIGNVAHRIGHAVGQSFAGDDDLVGGLQDIDELTVELCARIRGIGHFRLHRRVVLGVGIGAFRHVANRGDVVLLPALQSRSNVFLHVVAGGADQAVLGPDEQRIAPALFQAGDVGEHAIHHRLSRVVGKPLWRLVHPLRQEILGGDLRERSRMVTGSVLPPGRMGDVENVMRIHGDMDVVELLAGAVDESGKTLHVRMGTGNGK